VVICFLLIFPERPRASASIYISSWKSGESERNKATGEKQQKQSKTKQDKTKQKQYKH
jgi:hypothetical protein